MRALADERHHDHSAEQRQAGGGEQRLAPRQRRETANEPRRGGAHGQGADQDADREPAALEEPRGHDLHGGRVGAGHRNACHEAERQRRGEGIDPERERGVGRGADERAARHQVAGRPDVREIAERAGEGAGEKAQLHGDGETGAAAGPQRPLALERGEDGGGAEPEAEREQLRQRQRGELPPALGHRDYSTTFFSRSAAISPADMPISLRTTSVCSPARGAAERTLPGVSESLMATPTWRTRPCVGCWVSTIICRWLISGSRTISSTSETLPTHTSAFTSRSYHSSRSRERM